MYVFFCGRLNRPPLLPIEIWIRYNPQLPQSLCDFLLSQPTVPEFSVLYIITDIEIRIAELFNEHLQGQPIVGMREVEKIISIMGTPEEFGATIDEEPSKTKAHSAKSKRSGKRLFRDPDEKVIAGVCSGLAAYLGIDEPVWVRLFMVLLIFTGFAPLIYIVLWIAIPEAKTSGDKLSMRGEKIDVSNIARKVEQEINNLADTITEMTKDLGSKKKV